MWIRPVITNRSFSLSLCHVVLFSLLAIASHVQADWTIYTGAELSSTTAEVWINADHIMFKLEIGDRDREVFAALMDRNPSGVDIFHHSFVSVGKDREPLTGEIKVRERRPRLERPTPFQSSEQQMRGSPMVTYIELYYPLPERPETLTFTPPIGDDGVAVTDIAFIVYHQFIPVIDFHYLDTPQTLQLDWSDPWYSAFENTAFKRHHRAPLMTFLYVEPYEVRYEILIRLKELASWLPVEVANPMRIDTLERSRLLEQIGQFFLRHSQVRIDGHPPRPMLDRIQFVKVTPQGIQPLDPAEPLTFHTAIVGVILAYATPGPPREVSVDWTLFNDRMTSVPSTIIDPVSRLPYDVTPAQPTLRWTNMLANYNYRVSAIDAIAAKAANQIDIPAPSLLLCLALLALYGLHRLLAFQGPFYVGMLLLLLVGAIVAWPFGRMTVHNPFIAPYQLAEGQATAILQGLLQNIYRAFDFRDEVDIYDKLAVSITGDLITEIYLQSRKRLAVKEQGGAQAKVESVELLEATSIGLPDADQRMTFQCAWRIAGSVGHWGHSHWRRNQYEAMITIQPIEQTWKLVGLDLIDERRLP